MLSHNTGSILHWKWIHHVLHVRFDCTEYEVESTFNESSSSWSMDNNTIHCNLGTLSPGCLTPHYVPDVFFFSCLIFIGTFALSLGLKLFRNTTFFPNWVRESTLFTCEQCFSIQV